MRAALVFMVFVALWASAAACGGSSWSLPLPALDRVPLSVSQPGLPSGGRGVFVADGVILRRDASGWRVIASPTATGAYFKVWGSSANDVFICGQGGTILHWDGAALTPQPTGLAANVTLFTVHGRAPNDVYAVGGL